MPRRKKRRKDDATLERTLHEADAAALELRLKLRITSVHSLIVEVKDGKVKATHELDTRYIDGETK